MRTLQATLCFTVNPTTSILLSIEQDMVEETESDGRGGQVVAREVEHGDYRVVHAHLSIETPRTETTRARISTVPLATDISDDLAEWVEITLSSRSVEWGPV
jgi:hypothetical protein